MLKKKFAAVTMAVGLGAIPFVEAQCAPPRMSPANCWATGVGHTVAVAGCQAVPFNGNTEYRLVAWHQTWGADVPIYGEWTGEPFTQGSVADMAYTITTDDDWMRITRVGWQIR